MSKGEVKMDVVADLFTVAKVAHIASEQGRDFNDVAVELLEREADKELAKVKPPTGVVVVSDGKAGVRVEGGADGAVVVVGDGNRVTL